MLEWRWCKDKTIENWTEYKNLRNIYNHRLRVAKRIKLSKMVNECGNDIGQLYQIIDSVTGRNMDNPMPSNISMEELTEMFADFFLDKIVRLRNELSEVSLYEPLWKDIKIQLKEFMPVEEEEVMKYMTKLGSKKCELDPIPVNIYKQLTDKLVAITTHIVNTSLQSSFPEKWKEAQVKPLIKKPTLPCEYKNYQPVSNLCVISKIIEKAALNQIILHLDENARLPSYQSAYHALHSTETTLVDLIDNLLWNLEKQELSVVAIMDLLAAFDTVDHNLLRSILNEQYGITGEALEWIDSYLRPRGYHVSINGSLSMCKNTPFSGPQGSCLGPFLYLAYAGTLEDILEPSKGDLTGFADDHALCKSFNPSVHGNQEDTIESLRNSLLKIKRWMDSCKLAINTAKTELVIFGARAQLAKTNISNIDVVGDVVD